MESFVALGAEPKTEEMTRLGACHPGAIGVSPRGHHGVNAPPAVCQTRPRTVLICPTDWANRTISHFAHIENKATSVFPIAEKALSGPVRRKSLAPFA